ncbi:BTAD domain-containing putative transcriptional regulator [Nonomuraea sp. NPDC050394]|uniref:AfsR/SARP family transcriptional regulator n=1 Tax=Nonomuraea sp. NPDC050394 TaxID=3364363 RepID=UPI0037907795
MLEIKLLGHHRSVVRGEGTTRGGRLQLQPVAASLLAYLVLQRERPQPRDVVAAAFWGGLSTAEARRRLNTALWRLRRVIEPAHVARGTYLLVEPTGAMSFNGRSDARVDVARFEAAVTPALGPGRVSAADAERLKGAVGLYVGDLLEGTYDDWVVLERERLRELHLRAMARLLTWYRGTGDLDTALTFGQAILDAEPLREDVHRAMIEMHAAAGRRAQALSQYEICRRLLRDELGVDPLPETTAAAARIASGAPAAWIPGQEHDVRLLGQLERAETELRGLADVLGRAADELRALTPRPPGDTGETSGDGRVTPLP